MVNGNSRQNSGCPKTSMFWALESVNVLPYKAQETLAAAAAKSLQSCPTLCEPIDGSSPILGILQARTGVGCHFLLQYMKVKSESEVTQLCRLLATPWAVAYQAPPSMGFSRQEYWSALPFSSPRDFGDVLKLRISRWEDDPGLSRWTQYNHKGPYKRRKTGQCQNKEMWWQKQRMSDVLSRWLRSISQGMQAGWRS